MQAKYGFLGGAHLDAVAQLMQVTADQVPLILEKYLDKARREAKK